MFIVKKRKFKSQAKETLPLFQDMFHDYTFHGLSGKVRHKVWNALRGKLSLNANFGNAIETVKIENQPDSKNKDFENSQNSKSSRVKVSIFQVFKVLIFICFDCGSLCLVSGVDSVVVADSLLDRGIAVNGL